jgi:hypothetical protein
VGNAVSQKLEFVHFKNKSETLIVWFSAFTNGPKLAKLFKVKKTFHGYRIARSNSDYDWLLLRENYGYTNDGSYYSGTPSNYFIESQFAEIFSNLALQKKNIVFIGSSMGGYAAIKFALIHGVKKVALFSPHLDLKIARALCGRKKWIDFLTSNTNESPSQKDLFLMRLQILVHELKGNFNSMSLFIQASIDDFGVFNEQVIPFIKEVGVFKPDIFLDRRESGGHSGLFMSDELILYVLESLSKNQPLSAEKLRNFPNRHLRRSEKIERVLQIIENFLFSKIKGRI